MSTFVAKKVSQVMTGLGKVAEVYPKFKVVNRRVVNPDMSLNELRAEIWRRRSEFWLRKLKEMPVTMEKAKGEWAEVKELLRNPGEIEYRQVGAAAVWGIQIAGAFCIGEILARKDLHGYNYGRHPGVPYDRFDEERGFPATEGGH